MPDLRSLAHDAYYQLKYPQWRDIDLSGSEKRAAKLMVQILGPEGMPGNLVFKGPETLRYWEYIEEVAEERFKEIIVVNLKESDLKFLFGLFRQPRCGGRCKSGIFKIANCPHCNVETPYGRHLHSFIDLGRVGDAPLWHRQGCKVTQPSMPCH